LSVEVNAIEKNFRQLATNKAGLAAETLPKVHHCQRLLAIFPDLYFFPAFRRLPRQFTSYRSWRRSRRFCTVPLLRAICRVSGRKSAKATVSTLGVVSAAMPSRAKGKSQGVKMQLWAYWISILATFGRLPTLPDITT